MTRYIVILVLVAAAGFGAGRLTAPANTDDQVLNTTQSAEARAVSATTRAAAARQAVQDAAPALASARSAREARRDQLATADFDALLDLADNAQQLASPAQRQAAIKSIIERMTELDPAGALDYAGQLTDGFARRVAQTTVIASVAQTDAQLAISMITGLANDNNKQSLYTTAINAMALEDPVRALEIAQSLPGQASYWIHQVYGQWGRYDPEGALAHSANLTDPGSRRSAKWMVARAWLQSDQDAAISWLESASATLANDERDQLLHLFMQTSPELSARLAALASPQMREQAQMGKVMALTAKDPAAAARIYEQMSVSERRVISANTIASSWAKKDRQAALEWAQQLTGEDKASAEMGVLAQWVKEDRAAALSYIDTLDDSRQLQITRFVAGELSQTDPAGAFALLRARATGERADTQAMWSLARQWSARDPMEAVAAFAQHQDEAWSELALKSSLNDLARRDPGEAKQWIARMTTDEARGFATHAVASGLARNDPESALTWSQSLNGAERDHALAGVASSINNDPQRQYDIAQMIQDSRTRGQAVRIAILSMGRNNVELATQWLASADLDDFQHEELRRYLERQ